MSLQIFIAIFGVMLGAGVGIFMALGKLVDGFKQYGKGPLAHLSITSIITGAITFLISFLSKDIFNSYILFLIVFLVAGSIHVYIMYKKFWSKSGKNKLTSELLYTLSIVLLMCVVFSCMQYFIQDKNFMYYPMLLSTLAFFIPMLLHKTFEKALAIPQEMYQKWYYPLHNPLPEPDDEDMRDLIVIGFEMEKNIGENQRTYFRARAPQRMDLGALFYHFINDYNETHSETPIQIINDYGKPFAWIFENKGKWYNQRKVFNPEDPIFANKIKENTVIICKRFIEQNNED